MLLLPSLTLSRKTSSTLALALTLFAVSATRAGATTYDFQTFDDPEVPISGTLPQGISGSNIVGIYDDVTGLTHGFIFNGTTFTTLDAPHAGTNSFSGTYAEAIDGNNIAGYFYDVNSSYRGFIYNGTAYSNFTLKNAPASTYVYGISGKNLVGAYYNPVAMVGHGFFYNGTTAKSTDIDDPKADIIGDTYPQAVQGNLVVGYYYSSDGNTSTAHGFLYDGTNYTAIDDPNAGTLGTHAQGISNGVIVGFYYDSDFATHGFVYDGSSFTDLDVTNATQTIPMAINNGNITGDYYDSFNNFHGFLATPFVANVTAAISPGGNPKSTSVSANTNANFSVTYTGVPVPTIQWQISTTAGAIWSNVTSNIDGTAFSGFNSATLTVIKPSTGLSGALFRAVVTNSGGSVYSNFAGLTVTPVAVIVINNLGTNLDNTQQFSGITYPLAKQAVTLTVSAAGPGVLSYQWLFNGKAISKATAANLTVSPFATANAGNYTVVVHSTLAANVTSSVIPLALGAVPAFPKAPASVTVASGANATFTAVPAGSPTPDIQWQSSSNGGKNWTDLNNGPAYKGTDTTTLTVTANSSLNGILFQAEANNIFNTVDSKSATLTVTPPPLASNLQGTYKIQTINVSLGLFGTNISLPTAAKNFSLKLTSTGLAGVSSSVADNLVATLGQGSKVTITPTTATTTAYNANITGTISFLLGDVPESIVLDKASTVSAAFDKSNNLVITANIMGKINGASSNSTVTVVITLAK